MQTIKNLERSLSVFTKTWKYLKMAKKNDRSIHQLKKTWSEELLNHLKIDLTVKGSVSSSQPLLLVGNHISYIDIVILLNCCEQISFVSKQEIRNWPVIGQAAQKIDTIFVKRENQNSRVQARQSILHALKNDHKRVVLFPSGTTSINENNAWKKGAFHIASEAQIPMQVFRINYQPLRAVAYIDQDNFFTHLMNLSSLTKIKAEIEFHSPVQIQNADTDCLKWQKWAQTAI